MRMCNYCGHMVSDIEAQYKISELKAIIKIYKRELKSLKKQLELKNKE